jgi:hypothetical protein
MRALRERGKCLNLDSRDFRIPGIEKRETGSQVTGEKIV